MLLTTEGTNFTEGGHSGGARPIRLQLEIFEQKEAKETKSSVRFQPERSSPPWAH